MGYTKLERSGSGALEGRSALAAAALEFIREDCEELRFDEKKTKAEETEGFMGTGLRQHEIPYDMQMDVDRLCLEKALERFLHSGNRRTLSMYIFVIWRCSWGIMKRRAR